jgi:hypothetical protein
MIQSAFYIQPFFVFPTPELLPVFFERVVHFGTKAFCDWIYFPDCRRELQMPFPTGKLGRLQEPISKNEILIRCRCEQRVSHQHRNCHGTDATGYRRYERGFRFDFGKGDIADQFPAFQSVDSYIDYDRSLTHHLSPDHFCFSGSG